MTAGRSHARVRRTLASAGLAAVIALAVAGCVTTLNTFPPPGATPGIPGDVTGSTVAQVIGVLRAQGLDADVAVQPYRPAEGPLLAGAPRSVIEVQLPDAQSHTWVVVYELPTEAAAMAAAEDHAAYLAAGIGGGALFAKGTEFVVQVVARNVLFFNWLPATAPDTRIQTAADALRTIGTPVEVNR